MKSARAERPAPDRPCIICGQTFKPRSRATLCCSRECSDKNNRRHAMARWEPRMPQEKTCERGGCGAVYKPKASNQRFCSIRCRQLNEADIRRGKSAVKPAGDQICWTCRRAAGPRMCSWAACGEPVEGWDATFCPAGGAYALDTYAVRGCPLYAKDER